MAPIFLHSNTRLLLIPLWNIKISLKLFFYSSTNVRLNVIRNNMARRNWMLVFTCEVNQDMTFFMPPSNSSFLTVAF